ncbi:MAG: hypothetical protein Q8O89_02270 [Nanoarchaeota archaeon]|nr:hypothetical protein [Nanoarchaeota archaeon]
MDSKKIFLVLAIFSIFIIAGCGKAPDQIKQTEEPTTIVDNTPPVDTTPVKEVETKAPVKPIETPADKPVIKEVIAEVPLECQDVVIEFAALNGHEYCIAGTTSNLFRFGVKNNGPTRIESFDMNLFGQKGSSFKTALTETELMQGLTQKLSVYYDTETYGKVWKVEITPRVYKADKINFVACANAMLVVDAEKLPNKTIENC